MDETDAQTLALESGELPVDVEAPVDASEATTERQKSWFGYGRNWLSLFVVAVCTGYVLFLVRIDLVFLNTTPTGGDMGAHVWGPAFLRDYLLPNGQLTGWTKDWYQGFPAYTFYMIVPSLAIVLLDVGIFAPNVWWGALGLVVLAGIGVGISWWATRHFAKWARWCVYVASVVVWLACLDLPYAIAFKLVAVSGLIAFPGAILFLGRSLGLRQPGPELMCFASIFFLSDRWLFHIYGGNIASTMAGEFAFSISFTLSIIALGLVARGVATGKYRGLAAATLGLAAMCHVIPAFFVAIGAIVLVVLRPTWRSIKWTMLVGPTSVLLAMWWYLPFYGHSDYLNDMGWEKIGVVRDSATCAGELSWDILKLYLWPVDRVGDNPVMFMGMYVFILAIIGAILSVLMMVRAGIFFAIITGISVLAFAYMPQDRFWNARVLPFYYLSVYMLAGIGAALLVRVFVLVMRGRWIDVPLWGNVMVITTTTLVFVIVMGLWTRQFPGGQVLPAIPKSASGESKFDGYSIGPFSTRQKGTPVRGWAKWNFEGIERKPGTDAAGRINTKDSNEYFSMINTMKAIGQDKDRYGCGMAYWEFDNDFLGKYGTPMSPMLLPYFTDGCIGSMEGLYFEASSTTPFHFGLQSELSQKPSRAERMDSHLGFSCHEEAYSPYDHDAGVKHLQLLGVRYYMVWSAKQKQDASEDSRLSLVADNGVWRVYEVAGWKAVQPLEYLPAKWTDVEDNIHSWVKPAWEWFNDESQWPIYRASGGPDDWPSMSAADASAPRIATQDPDLNVTNLLIDQQHISFDVDKVGTPVVIRTSYFPNWEATGADGPWRVTPNFMVVTPTSTHVELSYGSDPIEWVGYGLSLIGLLLLILIGRKQDAPSDDPVFEWFGDRELRAEDEFWSEVRAQEAVPHPPPPEGSMYATGTMPKVLTMDDIYRMEREEQQSGSATSADDAFRLEPPPVAEPSESPVPPAPAPHAAPLVPTLPPAAAVPPAAVPPAAVPPAPPEPAPAVSEPVEQIGQAEQPGQLEQAPPSSSPAPDPHDSGSQQPENE